MKTNETILRWIELFNRGNAEKLAELYHEDAIMHQMVYGPVKGREAIKRMLSAGFKTTRMTSVPEQIIETEQWVVLEWKDSAGVKGCSIFYVCNGRIKIQRAYWDKLTFLKKHKLPLPPN